MESDHSVINLAYKLPSKNIPVKKTISFRPLTVKGEKMFEAMITATDWTIIEKGTSSDSAEALNDLLQNYIMRCFPLRTRNISSNDAPWFN